MEEMLHIDNDFDDFISPTCNRKNFIQSFLARHNIDCPILRLDGRDHLYVNFPQKQYNGMFKIKTIIAHYDRVEGSPGANDNSAAVYYLLQWAVHLAELPGYHNVRLIFTDGEESTEGVQSQGAFKLAETFKKLNISNDDVLVFDACGRGEIPVISQMDFLGNVNEDFIKRYNSLENRTRNLVLSAVKKGICLPTNLSDNASFIANGIPAITITFLPEDETIRLMNGKTPETWKLFHTSKDNRESLTEKSATTMEKILLALERNVTPAMF